MANRYTTPPDKVKRYTGIRIDRATCEALVKATGATSRAKAYEIVIKDYLAKHPTPQAQSNTEEKKEA